MPKHLREIRHPYKSERSLNIQLRPQILNEQLKAQYPERHVLKRGILSQCTQNSRKLSRKAPQMNQSDGDREISRLSV